VTATLDDARVSTTGQDLDTQLAALIAAGVGRGWASVWALYDNPFIHTMIRALSPRRQPGGVELHHHIIARDRDRVGKLVPDNIPDIIRAPGRTPRVTTLRAGAYQTALAGKLGEQVAELTTTRTTHAIIEKAADAVGDRGATLDSILDAAQRKRAERRVRQAALAGRRRSINGGIAGRSDTYSPTTMPSARSSDCI
jgi:predicted house-cleaning noncanonical NTP pyrophosphatase (MazG superfamily)